MPENGYKKSAAAMLPRSFAQNGLKRCSEWFDVDVVQMIHKLPGLSLFFLLLYDSMDPIRFSSKNDTRGAKKYAWIFVRLSEFGIKAQTALANKTKKGYTI